MNAPHRRAAAQIERTDTPAGIEVREVIPGRPDSPVPTITGSWTIRRPNRPTSAPPVPVQKDQP